METPCRLFGSQRNGHLMNDELNGQLTSGWRIPAYARSLLWLDAESGVVKTEGEYGLFQLRDSAHLLTLRWGGADGPALTQFRWQPDSLNWDGSVRLGGFVDAMHLTEALDLTEALAILYLGGQPLKPSASPYPTYADRRRVPYPIPAFQDDVADQVEETVTTWMALADSPLMALAQDALVSKLRIFCFGRLAEAEAGWHEHFALPLVREALTLFGP